MSISTNKKTRVLYLVASAHVIGGIETNLLAVLSNADKYDLEVAGVLVPSDGEFTNLLKQCQVPIGYVSYYGWRWSSPWRYVHTYIQLLLHIKRMSPDVIHITHQWLAEYGWGLKQLIRQPIICDMANLEDEKFIRARERYFARLDRVIVRSMAVGVNLDENSRRKIVKILIPNGIETTRFANKRTDLDLRNELDLKPDNIIIGFIGRLVAWKGIEDLLVAWRMVWAAYPKARLLIVGQDEQEGRYHAYLKHQAQKLGIASSVIFLGFREDVDSIMHNLDIFVLPSHNEPFGIVTVEAMASGCLIVGTNGGGTPEIVIHRETGYLVPVGQPELLAEGIQWALSLSPEDAITIRAAAQLRAKKFFDIDVQLKAQAELYRELLGEG